MGTRKQRFPHRTQLIWVTGLAQLQGSSLMALKELLRILLSKMNKWWTPCLPQEWSWWRRMRCQLDPGFL